MAGPESRSKIATGDHCLTALQQNFQDTILLYYYSCILASQSPPASLCCHDGAAITV